MPTFSGPTTATISEATLPGTGVGLTVSAATSAADSATIARYDITNSVNNGGTDSMGTFAIDPSSGVVILAKALDYETDTSHVITVTTTTTDGITATQNYTINVTDVNEVSTIAVDSNGVTTFIEDNSNTADGAIVLTLSLIHI